MNPLTPVHLYSDWAATRSALHQAAQVLNALKVPAVPRQPNALHHSLQVEPNGLTTGQLDFGGALYLGYRYEPAIWYHAEQGSFTIPLDGHSQGSLLEAVLTELQRAGRHVQPRRDDITATTPLVVNSDLSHAYFHVLGRIWGALARFRAQLGGMMTPLVLWPHHFDLSFLYFLEGRDEHQDPHLNFGFSPASPGLPDPYLYAYRYPLPAGLVGQPLPAAARWHETGWTGVVIDYAPFTTHPNPEDALEYTLSKVWAVLAAG